MLQCIVYTIHLLPLVVFLFSFFFFYFLFSFFFFFFDFLFLFLFFFQFFFFLPGLSVEELEVLQNSRCEMASSNSYQAR